MLMLVLYDSAFSFKTNQHIHVRVLFILPRVLLSKSNYVHSIHSVHSKTKRKLGSFHKTPTKKKKKKNGKTNYWISIRHYLTGFSHYRVSWIFAADIFQIGPLLVVRIFFLFSICYALREMLFISCPNTHKKPITHSWE